jgi:hypothetical protein
METDQPAAGVWGEPPAQPPLSPSIGVLAPVPLRLRPLWIGFALSAVGGVFMLAKIWSTVPGEGLSTQPVPALMQMFSTFAGIAAAVYYFMCIHRLYRVLGTQSGWQSEFTPAEIVWQQFIPFFGIFVLYQWTGDVESYMDWRLETSAIGKQAFLGLMVGFVMGLWVPIAWLGHGVVFGALAILYGPVRRAMLLPPLDSGAPGYHGTLGLR